MSGCARGRRARRRGGRAAPDALTDPGGDARASSAATGRSGSSSRAGVALALPRPRRRDHLAPGPRRRAAHRSSRSRAATSGRSAPTASGRLLPQRTPRPGRRTARLAFVSRRSGDEEIYVAPTDATADRSAARPQPPGRRTGAGSLQPQAEIWTMNANGSASAGSFERRAWHEHYSPTWHAPDRLLLEPRLELQRRALRVPPSGSPSRRARRRPRDDGMPDFSPDGSGSSSPRTATAGEIYLMNPTARARSA